MFPTKSSMSASSLLLEMSSLLSKASLNGGASSVYGGIVGGEEGRRMSGFVLVNRQHKTYLLLQFCSW